MTPKHFDGKDALTHIVEKQAKGLLSTYESETHGSEIPGHLFAGADAARDTAIAFLALWLLLSPLSFTKLTLTLAVFSLGWTFWKAGRAAWLGWFHLERMHRILDQERWEIEHHRPQERDELKELYKAKGFQEGPLLDDVCDVLMADEDRLLREMVKEELLLSLESYVHPLKQGFGAMIGALSSIVCCFLGLFLFPTWGLWMGSALGLLGGTLVSTHFEGNRSIPALIWNGGLLAVSGGCISLFSSYLHAF